MTIHDLALMMIKDPSIIGYRNTDPNRMIIMDMQQKGYGKEFDNVAINALFGPTNITSGPQLLEVGTDKHVKAFVPSTEEILAVDYMIFRP